MSSAAPGGGEAMEATVMMADELLTWFAQFGGKVHPAVTIAPQADGRGFRLVLKETTEATTQSGEQLVVSCPHLLALSILSIPLVAPWWPATWMDSLDPTVLTRFILVESWSQGAGAVFSKYIAMLPSPVAAPPFTTPLYWSEEERMTIKGTNLYLSTVGREKCWRQEFEQAKAYLLQQPLTESRRQNVTMYSYDLYQWAATVLSSRCFSQYMVDSQSREVTKPHANEQELLKTQFWQRWLARDQTMKFPVLLPIFDAANHDPRAKVSWNNSGNTAQLLVSIEDMRPGQEIFNNYGQKANEELILGYGFDLEQNQANSFLIPLDLAHKKEKLALIRDFVQQTLVSEKASILLPQILNPVATLQATTVYALRDDEDPLSSAASTPLALMALNTRGLHDRRRTPLSIPSFSSSHGPSHNSLETVFAFAYILRRDLYKIHSTQDGVPAQPVIDASHNMQMGMRHRRTQLSIIEHGIISLQKTLASWFSTRRIVNVNDLLTGVLPRSLLKRFRQMVHQALATRNVDKLIRGGHSEAVFVFWLLNLDAELETIDDIGNQDMDFDDQQSMTLQQLATWLDKMKTAYGTYDTPAAATREESTLCWKQHDVDEAKIAADEYERILTWHKVLPNITSLRKRIDWALRIVREEAVWTPAWLHNEDDEVSGDDESQDEQKNEDMLVWVLVEPEST